jgi:hypothetical protein
MEKESSAMGDQPSAATLRIITSKPILTYFADR